VPLWIGHAFASATAHGGDQPEVAQGLREVAEERAGGQICGGLGSGVVGSGGPGGWGVGSGAGCGSPGTGGVGVGGAGSGPGGPGIGPGTGFGIVTGLAGH
jgi:hypothetical protein